MKVYVATKNVGKLREIRSMFAGSDFELDTYADYRDVAEDAPSYIGNALLKARALEAQLRDDGIEAAVLADDSGIEVDALGGRPGVLSARYAGVESSWDQRLGLLVRELRGVRREQRTARFVCVMALVLPGRESIPSVGIVEGIVTEKPIGEEGFGYDPIFYYPPFDCTLAQVPEAKKNSVSHRGRAARALMRAYRDGV